MVLAVFSVTVIFALSLIYMTSSGAHLASRDVNALKSYYAERSVMSSFADWMCNPQNIDDIDSFLAGVSRETTLNSSFSDMDINILLKRNDDHLILSSSAFGSDSIIKIDFSSSIKSIFYNGIYCNKALYLPDGITISVPVTSAEDLPGEPFPSPLFQKSQLPFEPISMPQTDEHSLLNIENTILLNESSKYSLVHCQDVCTVELAPPENGAIYLGFDKIEPNSHITINCDNTVNGAVYLFLSDIEDSYLNFSRKSSDLPPNLYIIVNDLTVFDLSNCSELDAYLYSPFSKIITGNALYVNGAIISDSLEIRGDFTINHFIPPIYTDSNNPFSSVQNLFPFTSTDHLNWRWITSDS